MKTHSFYHFLISIFSYLLLSLFLAFSTNLVRGSDMQIEFTGIVDEIAGSGVPGINLNDPVSGKLVYDPTVPDQNSSIEIGWFPNAISSYDINVGDITFTLVPPYFDDRSEIAIVNDHEYLGTYEDSIQYLGYVLEPGFVNYMVLQLNFTLFSDEPSSWVETDNVIPSTLDLSLAQLTRGQIRRATVWDRIFFSLTNVIHSPVPTEIEIDIAPIPAHKTENIINLKKGKNVQVAIVGSDLFSVLNVNSATVTFGPSQAYALKNRLRDYNQDGYDDLLLIFNLEATGIVCGDTEATLKGETYDGEVIEGYDNFTVIPCN